MFGFAQSEAVVAQGLASPIKSPTPAPSIASPSPLRTSQRNVQRNARRNSYKADSDDENKPISTPFKSSFSHKRVFKTSNTPPTTTIANKRHKTTSENVAELFSQSQQLIQILTTDQPETDHIPSSSILIAEGTDDAEYIDLPDLPIDLPSKIDAEYIEETIEDEAINDNDDDQHQDLEELDENQQDQQTTCVADESFGGEEKNDDSFFSANNETPTAGPSSAGLNESKAESRGNQTTGSEAQG